MQTKLKALVYFTSVAIAASADNPTNDAKESFLREARIVRTQYLSMGVTNSVKASLNNGVTQHDAHLQKIDEKKASFQTARGTELNFRDCYKYNIAAYELAKMLGLDMVPPSVERRAAGTTVAATWWVAR